MKTQYILLVTAAALTLVRSCFEGLVRSFERMKMSDVTDATLTPKTLTLNPKAMQLPGLPGPSTLPKVVTIADATGSPKH